MEPVTFLFDTYSLGDMSKFNICSKPEALKCAISGLSHAVNPYENSGGEKNVK